MNTLNFIIVLAFDEWQGNCRIGARSISDLIGHLPKVGLGGLLCANHNNHPQKVCHGRILEVSGEYHSIPVSNYVND
jgi:hypothetical protein